MVQVRAVSGVPQIRGRQIRQRPFQPPGSVRCYAPRARVYRQPVELPDANDDAADVPLPTVPNPRQIHSRLDDFVVAQERAKRILSVAVHNHQLRVQAVLRNRREAERRAEFEALERERKEREQEEQHSYGGSRPAEAEAGGNKGSRRVTPQAVEASIQLDEPASSSRKQSDSFNRRRHPGSSGPVVRRLPANDGDEVEIATFSPSYTPSSRPRAPEAEQEDDIDPATSRMLRQRLAVLTDSDKPQLARRRSNRPSSSTSAAKEGEGEVLSDFVGQQSGRPSSSGSQVSGRLGSIADELPFEKSNVMLLGPTGVGKSLLARTVAKQLDVPYSESCATTFTQAGYVGDDVESAVVRLLQEADGDVEKASRGVIFIDEVDKIARRPGDFYSKDVSGEGVQQALLRMLEGTQVTVSDKEGGMPPGPGRGRTRAGLPGFGGSGNKGNGEPVVVDTTNVLFILAGAFVGLDKVVQNRVAKGSIGFGAQLQPKSTPAADAPAPSLDSLGISTNDASKPQTFLPFFSSSSPTAAAPDLLDLVEPADLTAYGLIPEFVGRLPTVAALKPLTEDDLLRVLTEPRNALVQQYETLFSMNGVELRFTTPALREVARAALGKNTGARGLRRILENLLLDSMYSAPGSSIRYILIDRAVARGEKPAVFYSRGQKHIFHNDFATDQDPESKLESEAHVEVEAEQMHHEHEDEERHFQQRRSATG